MALYNPKDLDPEKKGKRWAPEAGTYRFKLDTAEEVTSKKGDPMLKVLLLVDVPGAKFDVRAYDYILLTADWLWKMQKLCECVGVPFDPAPETYDLENKQGTAKFKTEEYNGYTNLKVNEYLPDESGSGDDPPPLTDGDAPPF